MGDPGHLQELPIPSPKLTDVGTAISLLEPLSRRGTGPGLIVLVPNQSDVDSDDRLAIKNGVPSPLVKWAEEGYAVVEIQEKASNNAQQSLQLALQALEQCQKCEPKGTYGLVGE